MLEILFVIVLVFDLVVPFFIALPYKGYNHTKSVMSLLGCAKSPWHNLYNLWMVFSGVVITLLGYRLFSLYDALNYWVALVLGVLLALYGVCDEVVSGFFPVSEFKEDVSLSSRIHGIGSVIGFIALLFAPLFLAILMFLANSVIVGIISLICFVLGCASFVCFIMGDKPRFKDTVFALEGLWQRLVCLFLYIPFIVLLVKIS